MCLWESHLQARLPVHTYPCNHVLRAKGALFKCAGRRGMADPLFCSMSGMAGAHVLPPIFHSVASAVFPLEEGSG